MTPSEKKSTKTLPKMPLSGTVHVQFVRCGRANCRCRNGQRHGPYYYHFWRERGRLRKRYLKHDEAEQVRAACEARQVNQRLLSEAWREFRAIQKQLKGLQST